MTKIVFLSKIIWPVPGTHRYQKNFFWPVPGAHRYSKFFLRLLSRSAVPSGTHGYQVTAHADPYITCLHPLLIRSGRPSPELLISIIQDAPFGLKIAILHESICLKAV